MGWWGSQRLSSPLRPPRAGVNLPALILPGGPYGALRSIPSPSGGAFPCRGAGKGGDSLFPFQLDRVFPRSPSHSGPAAASKCHFVVASKQLTVSHSSAGRMLEIRVTAQPGAGGSPPCLAHGPLLAVLSWGGKRVTELRRVPFIKALIPFMRAAPW